MFKRNRLQGKRVVPTLLILALGSASAAVPSTPAPDPVRIELRSALVGHDAQGRETLSAGKPRPGDLLSWQATAINDLTRTVSDLTLTVPIPASTIYVAGSARLKLGNTTVPALYSWDGQTFAPAPLKRLVTVLEHGQNVTREVVVPPSQYRAVRWRLPNLTARSRLSAELRTSVR